MKHSRLIGFTGFMLFTGILAAALPALATKIASTGGRPEVGKFAPAFALPDVNGVTRALAQYKGKFVVLEWTNHGCPFVKKHYGSGNMPQLQKDLTGQGVVWLSIISSAPGMQGYCEPKEAKAQALEKKSSATAVLLDPTGAVGRLYGAKTTPHLFVIDKKGVVIYQGAIDDIPSPDPADLKTAKNYVRACLTAAMKGESVATPVTQPYGCSVKYAH